jgi:hypothetical protein
MVSRRIRTFNKYVTNRHLRGFAHRSHGPFALLYSWHLLPHSCLVEEHPS